MWLSGLLPPGSRSSCHACRWALTMPWGAI